MSEETKQAAVIDTANARLKEIYTMYYQGEFAPNESAISDLFGMIDARDEEVRRLAKALDDERGKSADEYTIALESENKRLRGALEKIAHKFPYEGPAENAAFANENRLRAANLEARLALKETR